MDIGIAKEISARGRETRAILLPREVKRITEEGYKVFTERGLGTRIGIADEEYRDAGAVITRDRQKIFTKDIVVKLKPPLPEEFKMMRNNILFSMLHAEQNPKFVEMMDRGNVKAIAMELVVNRAGERFIQCTDMSGEQGMLMAFHLARKSPADCKVVILGYGAVASGVFRIAYSLGSDVKILRKVEYIHVKHFIRHADIVVNGISWPKEKRDNKEYIITRGMLKLMNPFGLVLDLSVDYPNPIETCHPTLINKPTYVVDGITHISIFGYPGLAPISSSARYSRQVLPLLLKICSAEKLSRLPNYLKKAIIDPEVFEF
jgi:N5-(carboxyethyl)ornithine synthase